MKKLTSARLALSAMLLFGAWSSGAEEKGETNVVPKKETWQQREFLISAFQVLPDAGWDLDYLMRYRAAGFNVLETIMPQPENVGWKSLSMEEQLRLLDQCEKVGLKVLAVDHTRYTNRAEVDASAIEEAARRYGTHPALYGYYLWDEPRTENFESVGQTQALFQKLDPANLPYTVLLPSYGPYAWQHGGEDDAFPDYIRDFIEQVAPPVLAFDYYPFRADFFSEGYWSDLGFLRKVAVEKRLPYWIYIQSCGWDGMASPTFEQIRFQAWMALAYGATGIQYYVYHGLTIGSYVIRDAVVDEDGTPLPNYNGVAQLNRAIEALGPELLALNSQGVYHSGDEAPPYAQQAVACPVLEFASPGLVIGHFLDKDGRDCLVVVNKDYAQKTSAILEFTQPYSVSLLPEPPADAAVKQLKLPLLPGEGKLLRLEH